MIKVYTKSWRCIVTNWPVYLIAGIGIAGLRLWMPRNFTIVSSVICLIWFAYPLHRHFLFDESVQPVKALGKTSDSITALFFVASAVMVMTSVIMGHALGLFVISFVWDSGFTMVQLLLFDLAIFLIFLGTFGTTLPAALDGLSTSYNFAKAAEGTLAIIGCLLLGPGLICAALVWSLYAKAAAVGVWDQSLDANQTTAFAFRLVFALTSLLGTTLAAAVLCSACRKLVPKVDPSTHPA